MSSVDLMGEIESLKAQQAETTRRMAELQKLAAEEATKEREEFRQGLLAEMQGIVAKRLSSFAKTAEELGIHSFTLLAKTEGEGEAKTYSFTLSLGQVKGLSSPKASGNGSAQHPKEYGVRWYLGSRYEWNGGAVLKDGQSFGSYEKPTGAAKAITGYLNAPDGVAWFNLK